MTTPEAKVAGYREGLADAIRLIDAEWYDQHSTQRHDGERLCADLRDRLNAKLTSVAATAPAAAHPPITPHPPEDQAAVVRHGGRELHISRTADSLYYEAIGVEPGGTLDFIEGDMDTSPAGLKRTIEWLLNAPPQAAVEAPPRVPSPPLPEGPVSRPGDAGVPLAQLLARSREENDLRTRTLARIASAVERLLNETRSGTCAYEVLSLIFDAALEGGMFITPVTPPSAGGEKGTA